MYRFLRKIVHSEYSSGVYKEFSRSEKGNVAVLFAIVLVPMIIGVGMSIDYSHAVNVKAKIQAALDASALAAGRMLQTSGSASEATAVAEKHFASTIDKSIKATMSIDSMDLDTGKVKLSGLADVKTSFMSIAGVDTIRVNSSTTVEFGSSENIEVSLMLDVTLSMYGSKIKNLKYAAKDLVQIILQGNEGKSLKTRIALVPFSESVNVHKYAQEVANSASSKNKLYKVAKECVTERIGKEAFTDATPNGQNKVGALYNKTGKCKPTNDLVPLTDDKTVLQNSLDGLKAASGLTAGHLGTAWSWYTLSPNWKTVWPSKSRPEEYGDKTKKIAILMSDGEYNVQYKDGIRTTYFGSSDDDDDDDDDDEFGHLSPNGTSDNQADKLCKKMKAKGIIVYAVGFDLDSEKAIKTLRNCATAESYFFLAKDGEALRTAFRQIAFRIAQLRITK